MLNGYKFRLYPNAKQEQILLRWIGCQRLIYNAKVQEDRYFLFSIFPIFIFVHIR